MPKKELVTLGKKEPCMRASLFVWSAALVLVLGGVARSQVGGGYSVLSLDAANGDDLDGFEMRVRFPLGRPEVYPQPRLAFGVGFFPGGDAFEDPVSNLMLGTLGLDLAWRHNLGQSNLFLEPSVGGGATWANYTSRFRTLADIFEEDDDAFGWTGRVGVTLGFDGAGGNFGVEVSYSWLGIDFNDEADGVHNQFYVGLTIPW
jgi:hypothetical protein